MTVRCSGRIDQTRGLRPWSAAACTLLSLLAAVSAHAQISIEVPTTLVGSNIFSNSTQWPEVDVSTDGTVVFIWSENGYQAPSVAVTHAYSANGTELGPPVRVNQSGQVSFSSIVSDLRGGFVAAWDWNENSGNDQII